jgi:hypothetical protein
VKKRKQMTLFETPFQIRRSRCSIEGELIHNSHNHKTVKLQEAELSLTTKVLQPQVGGGVHLAGNVFMKTLLQEPPDLQTPRHVSVFRDTLNCVGKTCQTNQVAGTLSKDTRMSRHEDI